MEFLYKSAILIGLFYLFYKLFLERETFFKANRLYFIISTILVIVLPFIVFKSYKTIVLPAVTFEDTNLANTTIQTVHELDWMLLFWRIYLVGLVFFAIKYVLSLLSLLRFISSGERIAKGKYIFVFTDKQLLPFSFLHYIVLNKGNYTDKELLAIINHEKIHAKQYHSLDLFLANILQIIQWFNPFAWLYKKELEQNLEYIADADSQENVADLKSYQYLLLKTSIEKTPFAQSINFYNSLIKKRIIMLQKNQKNQSKKRRQFKFLLLLPVLALFLFSFNREEIIKYQIADSEVAQPQKSSQKSVVMVSINPNTTSETLAEHKTVFSKQGVIFKYSKLKRNQSGELTRISLKLTDTENSETVSAAYAVKNGTIKPIVLGRGNEGLFIKTKDVKSNFRLITSASTGNKDVIIKKIMTDANVQVVQEIKSDKDEATNGIVIINTKKDEFSDDSEADIKVIKILENGNTKTVAIYKGNKSTTQRISDVLYILDGKETKKPVLDKLDIKSINVIKGEKAVELYGEKGKDGVIIINTKNDLKPLKPQSNGHLNYKGVDYFYRIEKGEYKFYNRYGEEVKDNDFIKVLKIAKNDKKNTSLPPLPTIQEENTGFINFDKKTYYFIIKKGEHTFYNRYGEEIKDKTLVEALNKEVK